MSGRTRVGAASALAIMLVAGTLPVRCLADDHTLHLFATLEGALRPTAPAAGELERREGSAQLSLFAATTRDGFRALLEATATVGSKGDSAEAELERLQLGWHRGTATGWVGRFHSPLGYWHDRFHHGEYAQPSLSHPPLAAFEDDAGIFPQHLVGLLAEWERLGGDEDGWTISLAAGAGPELTGDALEPMDLLSPGDGRHGLSAGARLLWRAGGAELAFLLARHRIPQAGSASEARLTVTGGYAVWEGASIHAVAELVHVRSRIGARTGQLTLGYAYLARALGARWLLYARADAAANAADDPWLARFPRFRRRGGVIGLRWDLGRRHALKLELARHRLAAGKVREALIQWSAVWP